MNRLQATAAATAAQRWQSLTTAAQWSPTAALLVARGLLLRALLLRAQHDRGSCPGCGARLVDDIFGRCYHLNAPACRWHLHALAEAAAIGGDG